jgi:hypothetical protein
MQDIPCKQAQASPQNPLLRKGLKSGRRPQSGLLQASNRSRSLLPIDGVFGHCLELLERVQENLGVPLRARSSRLHSVVLEIVAGLGVHKRRQSLQVRFDLVEPDRRQSHDVDTDIAALLVAQLSVIVAVEHKRAPAKAGPRAPCVMTEYDALAVDRSMRTSRMLCHDCASVSLVSWLPTIISFFFPQAVEQLV